MTSLLSLQNISAGYVADIDILRSVNVSIGAGAITGLIGLNGAGKSTIMKTICGFLKPSTGKVEDNLVLPLEHLARRKIGLTKADLTVRLEDCFEKFPLLRQRARAKAGDLSGGQQKMVEFAKAYLVQPRLCLIDEPSIGLAPRVAEEVYQWINLFAQEKMAILLVDHNVRRVVKMSSYIYVLSLGEITAEGKPKDFAGDLHEQVKSWLGINF
jgi:branched-chain amino acid transport system ATP-binding protein